MKGILAALLFISSIGYGQTITPVDYEKGKSTFQPTWFIGISLDSARILSDKIASMAKHKYAYIGKSELGRQLQFHYSKDGVNDESTNLVIPFKLEYKGGNKDLEIEGIPRYFITKIEAVPLVDIFPFWKAYIDPDAVIEDIADKGDSQRLISKILQSDGRYVTQKFILRSEYGGWMLWQH